MIGYPDGTFRPGQQITAREAAKTFLYIIGYKEYIGAFGIDRAIQVSGILDGLESVEKLNVQHLARMMWNALHAPAIEMGNITTNGAEYKIDESYLGLDKLHGLVYARGVVDGIPGTKLDRPDQSLDSNEIYIGGEKFVYNFADKFGTANEFLGYQVDFYFKEYSSGVKEISYIRKADKNNVLVLNSDDIEDFSNLTFSYWEGDKEKKAAITLDTDVIFNDIAYPAYTDDEIIPGYGTVTLIDNDGKKGYEVVRVDSYEFYLINSVDTSNVVFYDVEEGTKLDLSKADDYRITWDGDEYPIERIIYGDFIIVKRTSPDSGYYYAEIDVRKDARPVSKIEAFDIKDGTLRAGGIDYRLWTGIDEESKSALKNGAIVTLYFSLDGTVVRIEKGTGSKAAYGYLVNVVSDGTFSEEIKFRLVDNKAQLGNYDMGKTIKIDGYSYNSFDSMANTLAQTAQAYELLEPRDVDGNITSNPNERFYNPEFPYAQPVRYELTETGLLKSLDTIRADKDASEDEMSLDFYTSTAYTMRNQNYTLYNGGQMAVTLAGSATKLQIPFKDRNDEENYSLLTWGDGDSMAKELSYNIDERIYIPEAHYHFENATAVGAIKEYRPVIVKEKLVELNAEGDTVYTLVCYQQKTEVTYTAKEEDVVNVEVGDMIRVELNADKSIKEGRLQLVYDASTGRFAEGSGENGKYFDLRQDSYDYRPYIMGYKAIYVMPLYIKDGYLRITSSVPSDGDSFNPYDITLADNVGFGNAIIYKYSEVRGNVVIEPATQSDILPFYTNQADPSEMVMIIYGNGVNMIYIIDKD